MSARLIAAPFVLATIIFFYLTLFVDQSYSFYIIWPIVIAVFLFILEPQINWWFYQRNPPALDPVVVDLLNKHHTFYRQLSPKYKKRFEDRVALTIIGSDYMPQAMPGVPGDIKGFIASASVSLTFGKKDFLLPTIQKIVIYPHNFPTPQIPQLLHSSEYFAEDGVLLFSIDPLGLSFKEPRKHFNIAYYELSKAFRDAYPRLPYPALTDQDWPLLERISGFNYQELLRQVNLPELDPQAVAMAYFFCFPMAFKTTAPDLYSKWTKIFNLDPTSPFEPLLFTNQ